MLKASYKLLSAHMKHAFICQEPIQMFVHLQMNIFYKRRVRRFSQKKRLTDKNPWNCVKKLRFRCKPTQLWWLSLFILLQVLRPCLTARAFEDIATLFPEILGGLKIANTKYLLFTCNPKIPPLQTYQTRQIETHQNRQTQRTQGTQGTQFRQNHLFHQNH